MKQGVQTTQPEVLLPIQSNRSTMSPRDGNVFPFLVAGQDGIVCPIQITPVESCTSLAGLLAALVGVCEEYLAAYPENLRTTKTLEERVQKVFTHKHVVIQ